MDEVQTNLFYIQRKCDGGMLNIARVNQKSRVILFIHLPNTHNHFFNLTLSSGPCQQNNYFCQFAGFTVRNTIFQPPLVYSPCDWGFRLGQVNKLFLSFPTFWPASLSFLQETNDKIWDKQKQTPQRETFDTFTDKEFLKNAVSMCPSSWRNQSEMTQVTL